MALYDHPHGRAPADPRHGQRVAPAPVWYESTLLPLILAAAIVIALIAMFYPGSDGRVGDTNNAGPSVRTVTPAPSPSTSPAVPTPTPTTDPRPTQGPIE